MHIKKVRIKNYKSYKDVEIDDLSGGLNVIVGHNGSGKSNFLSAIQCVMNPETYSLRADDKFQHINDEEESLEGSATIEIVFDNTSRRFPVQNNEVTLTRVLSSKKDSFMVDNKPISKQDMLNLLESIGFSKCNPYNIVRQGKVHELAIATDSERYNLLLDIAGVKVYDERRTESLNMLSQARDKKEQILKYIKEMEEKLNSLELEKREIIDLNRKEKEKKKIEYLIYEHDKTSFSSRIDQLNQEKQIFLDKLNDFENIITSKRDLIEESLEILAEKNNSKNALEMDYNESLEKLTSLFESKSRLEIDLHDLKSSTLESTHHKARYEENLKKLEKEILEKESQLKNEKQNLYKVKKLETTIKDRLQTSDWNTSQDFNIFESFQSRNEKEITIEEIQDLKTKSKELDLEIATYRKEIQKLSSQIESCKKKQLEAINTKKNLWTKESEISNDLNVLNQKMAGFEKKWNHLVPRDIQDGLKSLNLICQESKILGVFGPVFENFESDPRYFVSLDVTAGNKIFNVLVDSSKTATKILKIFKEKCLDGHITFMPLDNLQYTKTELPKLPDAIPLISKLKFDPKFEPAFRLIFGNTMLCKNKDTAFNIAKDNKLDGVTLEGDQVFHRGSIIGGFIDSRINTLEIYKNIKQLKESIQSKNLQINEIKKELENFGNEINKIGSQITKFEFKMNETNSTIKNLQSQLSEINENITTAEINRPELSGVYRDISQSQSVEDSLLECSVVDLEEKLRNTIFENTKIISNINSIESSLMNHFYIMRNDLKNKISELKDLGMDHMMKIKNNELSHIQNDIDSINTKINGFSII